MFIPVSLAQGATFVDVVVSATGNLVAQCSVIYKTVTYAPGASIPVVYGDTVRLSTTVTAYAEISVVLAGKTYYWYVNVPKTLRYVDDLAYRRTAGTTYGKLYHADGSSLPYTETGTFTSADAVASVDFVKKEIWFFNSKGEVKKLSFSEDIVSVVFAPRWSLAEGVATTAYVVTTTKVYTLSPLFAILSSFTMPKSGAVYASGDVNGDIIIGYADSAVRYRPSNGDEVVTIINVPGKNWSSIFVLADNTYVFGGDDGLSVGLPNTVTGFVALTTVVPYKGLYIGHALGETQLFVVDAYNRCLISVDLTTRATKTVFFDSVPRSVTINGAVVTVGFTNSTTSLDYDLALTTATPRTTVKTFGAAFMTDYVVTDLYSNAADVTKAEPAAVEALVQTFDIPVGTAASREWTVDWARPEYVKLGVTTATVKVNGIPFTEGYLRIGDVVSIESAGSAAYYDDWQVSLIGRRPTTFQFRTEPKLFPDVVTVPGINDAFPRYEYLYDYTVSGLTEGFTVDVVMDDTEVDMTFDVNHTGTFATTGRIKNGDVVTVRAWLPKLLSKRTPHLAYTGADKKWNVFSWTVLTITPNGVTLRPETTDKLDRYAEYVSPPTQIEESQYGEVYAPPVFEYAGMEGELLTAATGWKSDGPTHMRLLSLQFQQDGPEHDRIAQPVYSADLATHKLDSATKTFTHDLSFGTKMLHGTVVELDGNYSQMLGQTPSYNLGMPVQLVSQYSTPLKADMPTRSLMIAGTVAQIQIAVRTPEKWLGSTFFSTESESLLTPSKFWQVTDAEYALVPKSQAYQYQVNAALHAVRHLEKIDNQGWDHTLAGVPVEFTGSDPVVLARPSAFTGATYESRALVHRELFDVEVQRKVLGVRPTGDLLLDEPLMIKWQMRTRPAISDSWLFKPGAVRYAIDMPFVLYHKPPRHLIGTDWERSIRNIQISVNMVYVARDNSGNYLFESTAVKRVQQTRELISTVFVTRQTNSIMVAKPTPQFVTNQSPSYELSEEASGFGTLQQAQAYFNSLYFEEPQTPDYFQMNGKWIFTVRPLAENAVCSLQPPVEPEDPENPTAPSTRKLLYGYLGGG